MINKSKDCLQNDISAVKNVFFTIYHTWTKSNLCCKDRYSKQRTWHIGKMLLTLVHSKNLTNYFFIIQCLDITKKAQTKFQNQMISVIGFKEKQNKILSVSIRYHIKDMYKEKDFVYLVTQLDTQYSLHDVWLAVLL